MRLHHLSWVVVAVGGVAGAAIADDSATWNVRDHVPVGKFVIQSHRGAGELEAENTLPAFEMGWSLGTVPEADLRTTKVGVMVAFHDANFRRLVKGASPDLAKKGVKDVTWDVVRGLDVGAWKGEKFVGRRVPRMSEVFRAMTGRPERRLYMDIKNIDLKQLAGEVRAAHVEAQVILASPKHAVVREWKGLVPESGTLLWMGGTEKELEAKLADVRGLKFEGVTQLQIHVRPTEAGDLTPSPEFLTKVGRELRAHDILFQTLPWGTTEPKVYWRLLDLGVASFATDYPEITLAAVRKYYEQRR
jgi:glycerophosphoryl diester phosphodiesterase